MGWEGCGLSQAHSGRGDGSINVDVQVLLSRRTTTVSMMVVQPHNTEREGGGGSERTN